MHDNVRPRTPNLAQNSLSIQRIGRNVVRAHRLH